MEITHHTETPGFSTLSTRVAEPERKTAASRAAV